MSQKKRVRKSLTIEEKQHILSEVDKKVLSKAEICRIHGIPPSTLVGYLKTRDTIEQSLNLKSKKLRTPKFEALEEAVYSWIKQALAKSITLTTCTIIKKAEEIARDMNIVNFIAKSSWYWRFTKRYKISDLLSKEKQVRPFKQELPNVALLRILRKYDHKNVYIISVTGILFGYLPSKVYALKDEKCSKAQFARNRLTLLVGMNLDGSEKLPLLVVGKFKNPLRFEHCHQSPITYTTNSKSWITTDIFESWVHKLDSLFKEEKRKGRLVLHNYHASSNLAMSLNSLSIMQHSSTEATVVSPLLNSMVTSLKHQYRRLGLEKLIIHTDEGGNTSQFVQTQLDAMYDLKTAWNRVSTNNLVRTFRHDNFSSHGEDDLVGQISDENEKEYRIFEKRAADFLPEGITLDQYLSFDETFCTSVAPNSTDFMSDSDTEEEEEESGNGNDSNPPPTVADAREAITTLRKYYQTQSCSRTGEFIGTLINISSQMDNDTINMVSAKMSKPKQTSIQDFFKS